MISKGDWGVGYLAGTGLSLFIIEIWWFAIRREPDFTTFVGTTTGIILSLALIYLAYWLTQSELQDEHIWAVSVWGAVGLAIPTVPILGMVLFGVHTALQINASVLINIAAASAVIGALFGAVTELEEEHLRVLTLYRRNVMLNRVLRHDVRNDAAVLMMIAERMRLEEDPDVPGLAENIEQKAEDIVEVSDIARKVDEFDSVESTEPVEIVELISEMVDSVRSTHRDVDIQTNLPAEGWVLADDVLRTVVDNLIDNAIEHNDQRPEIRIAVEEAKTEPNRVDIIVADNGPGMPAQIISALSETDASSTTDRPQNVGLGLWLVKWFVDSYDGELSIEPNRPRGTLVRVNLPGTTPP